MSTLNHDVPCPIKRTITNEDGTTREVEFPAIIGGMGPAVRSFFVRALKARAWRELSSQAAEIDVARFYRLEASIMRDMTAGKYEWNEEVHDQMRGNKTGFELMLWARLRAGTGLDLPADIVELAIKQYGEEKLDNMMLQANGPNLPNSTPPTV